jgi:hypothetical protein
VVRGGWGRLAGRAGGGALIAAAAQVGLAAGLGLTRWTDFATALTWVVFMYATAVLAGVALDWRRLARAGRLRRAGAVLAAWLGASLAVPLVWLPVRALAFVRVSDDILSPAAASRTVALAATAGVLLGAVLAAAVLASTAVAANVAAWVGWTWLVGAVSALIGAAAGTPGSPGLGLLDVPALPAVVGPVPTLLGTAAVLGVAVALPARRVGVRPLAAVAAGFAGPALVAGSYLVAVGGGQTSLVTVAAVAIGSLAAAAVALRAPARTRTASIALPPATPAVPALELAATPEPPAGPAPAPVAEPAAGFAAGPAGELAAGSAAGPEPVAGAAPVAGAPAGVAPAGPTSGAAAPAGATSGAAGPAGATAAVAASAPVPSARIKAGNVKGGAGKGRAKRGNVKPEAPAATEDGERLRRDEQEHVTWMQNLLNTPPDPGLVTRRRNT